MNEAAIQASHLRVVLQPNLGGPGLIDKMRNPDFRRRDGSRMNGFIFELRGLEAIIFPLFNAVDRRCRFPVALLITRSQDSGFRIVADVGLAEAGRNDLVGETVRRDFDNGAVGDPSR